ncbi:SI1L3 protein, partial [Onychorhynchus coronatus]|nr:SI1L3 protein [Onychorhynchus coronatus]
GASAIPEPLWHVPAQSRLPGGKRPGRQEPSGKDSPNRHSKRDPSPPSGKSFRQKTGNSAAPDAFKPRWALSPLSLQPPVSTGGVFFWKFQHGDPAFPSSSSPRPLPSSAAPQLSASVPKSFFSKTPGRSKAVAPGWKRPEEPPEPKKQVNVFGQPRLRASLRDLRSPRRTPKSTIEDDLKRLILMDNSAPEPESPPPLQRTLSDESLCGGRRDPPYPAAPSLDPEGFPGAYPSSTLPSRRQHPQDRKELPLRRMDPGMIPLPDTAGLEW